MTTDDERMLWVMNNKQLYTMWNLTDDTIEEFIRKNANTIDHVREKELRMAESKSRRQELQMTKSPSKRMERNP
jgi:hypothetical protein